MKSSLYAYIAVLSLSMINIQATEQFRGEDQSTACHRRRHHHYSETPVLQPALSADFLVDNPETPQTVTTGFGTDIILDTVVLPAANSGITLNPTTGVITVNVSGRYLIGYTVVLDTSDAPGGSITTRLSNQQAVSEFTLNSTLNTISLTSQAIVELGAGQTISAQVILDGSLGITVDVLRTELFIERIGPVGGII